MTGLIHALSYESIHRIGIHWIGIHRIKNLKSFEKDSPPCFNGFEFWLSVDLNPRCSGKPRSLRMTGLIHALSYESIHWIGIHWIGIHRIKNLKSFEKDSPTCFNGFEFWLSVDLNPRCIPKSPLILGNVIIKSGIRSIIMANLKG
jgi:antibiotic biosynthesis monooxygenase (ABM) superfamily enzyme